MTCRLFPLEVQVGPFKVNPKRKNPSLNGGNDFQGTVPTLGEKKIPTFNGKRGLNLLDVERLGLDICLEWDTLGGSSHLVSG